ncbi:hypothetical protein B0A48_11567 [Cryoendolithus antarcticus]|uniref:Fe2OG dioxygenase domain-containing protein n=1 Tax=Cryoendolithus antarcticus TaxID=1507870 RepID=A0A1V8SW89_9PEZI|nr:hypothetical protein B0A48_11567 [Cryoendolithus antarcticus]
MQPVTADTLHLYRIDDPPNQMYYIPKFITEGEETRVVNNIPSNRWQSLSKRRLQVLPTALTPNNTLIAAPLPVWLTDPIVGRIANLGVFDGAPHGINHCLINEYNPGQGIMPHEDGTAYYPIVATVSLCSTIVLDVTGKRTYDDEAPKRWRVVQEPRSLLLTAGSAYTDTLHGIAEVTEDVDLRADTVVNWTLLGDSDKLVKNGDRNRRGTRISLTYRDVNKVSALSSKIFGKAR